MPCIPVCVYRLYCGIDRAGYHWDSDFDRSHRSKPNYLEQQLYPTEVCLNRETNHQYSLLSP